MLGFDPLKVSPIWLCTAVILLSHSSSAGDGNLQSLVRRIVCGLKVEALELYVNLVRGIQAAYRYHLSSTRLHPLLYYDYS